MTDPMSNADRIRLIELQAARARVRQLTTELYSSPIPGPVISEPIRQRQLRFEDELCAYRRQRYLTQQELARRSGVDHSYIGRLETGSRLPSRLAVLKLSRGLGLPIADRVRLMASAGFVDNAVSVDLLVALAGDPGLEQSVARAVDAMAEMGRRLRPMTADERRTND